MHPCGHAIVARVERRHLEYFLAVVECGSFTSAARMLDIAPPSLSHAVASLERELGCDLFERLGRGVKLTLAGEALVEPAQRTLRSFALAHGAVRGAMETGFGRLSIISHTLWAVEVLVLGDRRVPSAASVGAVQRGGSEEPLRGPRARQVR